MADVPSPSPTTTRTPSTVSRPRTPADGPRRSTSFSVLPSRRRSTRERIDEILETGARRAESRPESVTSQSRSRPQSEPPSPPTPKPKQQQEQQQPPRMEPLLRGASRPERITEHDGDDSADETTGIVLAGSSRNGGNGVQPQNYQATSTSVRSRRGRQPTGDQPSNDGTVASEPRPSPRSEGSGWFSAAKKTLASFGSVELDNKGSVARDHLALERTFLAWLRTSVSFASIGIAVTQLFRLNTTLNDGQPSRPPAQQDELRRLGKPLGATFLGISILILFLGYSRYVRSQKWIMTGRFPASRGTVILVTLLTFGVMAASLAIVVVFSPGPREADPAG